MESNFYSSVVGLNNIRIEFVAASLMKWKLIAADVVSAYIQEFMRKKIYAIAGPEFGKWAGLKVIIFKALYVLNSSGSMW